MVLVSVSLLLALLTSLQNNASKIILQAPQWSTAQLLSTSFGCSKDDKVTATGWQVTWCDPTLYVIPTVVRWFPWTAISTLLAYLPFQFSSLSQFLPEIVWQTDGQDLVINSTITIVLCVIRAHLSSTSHSNVVGVHAVTKCFLCLLCKLIVGVIQWIISEWLRLPVIHLHSVTTTSISLPVAPRHSSEDTGFAYFSRRFESQTWHCRVISEIGNRLWRVNYIGPPMSTQPCIAKSNTSFGWGKDGKVTAAGWQVWSLMTCDFPLWWSEPLYPYPYLYV